MSFLRSLPDEEAVVDRLCELNVIEQVQHVARTTIVQDAWRRGQSLTLHGCVRHLRRPREGLAHRGGFARQARVRLPRGGRSHRARRLITTSLVKLEAVARTFAGPRPRTVLTNVSPEVPAGEMAAILGESGVGKSTLLNLIAGLDRADAGRIVVAGHDLATLADDELTRFRRKHVGFVFQAFHVPPYLTVAQNVGVPLALLGEDAPARAGDAGRVAGLQDRGGSMPRASSAASCSARRSRARSCTGLRWCLPTSRPAISTLRARTA